MSKFIKFIACSDVHGDMQDRAAVREFLRFNDSYRADVRLFLGDLFDFRALRSKATPEERSESMRKDWNCGMNFLGDYKPQVLLKGNHCVAEGTEIYTERGWYKIEELPRDVRVAQFDAKRNISFAYPEDYISDYSETLVDIRGALTRHLVTPGHDVIVNGEKVKARDLVGTKPLATSIWKSGFAPADLPPEDPDMIRLLTWVVCDGTVVDYTKYGSPRKIRVQFKLSYQHKIERLRALLDRMGVPYTFAECAKSGINVLQPYYIRIYGDWGRLIWEALGKKKAFPKEWAHLPAESLHVFLDELAVTDGSLKDASLSWHTTSPEDRDTVAEWCLRNGVDLFWELWENASGFPNAKPQYRVVLNYRERKQDCQRLTIVEVPYDKTAYCVRMPLGTIIVRYGGHVTFTGNCARVDTWAEQKTGIERDFAQNLQQEFAKATKGMTVYPYCKRNGVHRIGKLAFVHGYSHGIGAARKHALSYGHVVFGHTHAIDTSSVERTDGAVGHNVGALALLDLGYNAATLGTLRQAHGWAYGIISKSTGDYYLCQARKVGGQWITPEIG